MRNSIRLVAALFIGILTGTASAQNAPPSQGYFEIAHPQQPEFGAVSGVASATTDFIASTITRVRLQSIEYGERGDDACHIELGWRHGNRTPDTGRVRWHECSSSRNREAATDRSLREVSVGDYDAITGLQVCMNRNNTKIKGIRVTRSQGYCVAGLNVRFLAVVAGQMMMVTCDHPAARGRISEQSANCNNRWSSVTSTCPAGMAATGIRAHYTEQGSRKVISGLQLACRDLSWIEP